MAVQEAAVDRVTMFGMGDVAGAVRSTAHTLTGFPITGLWVTGYQSVSTSSAASSFVASKN
jgi:hypothetical protein